MSRICAHAWLVATGLLLTSAALAQAPTSDDARLAPCLDRQRPASERARLCRSIIDAPGVATALRRQAREAEARALSEGMDWPRMLQAAAEILAADPGDRLGHALRGHVFLNRGQPGDAERARDAYSEGLKHAPKVFLFANNRGIARSLLGDTEGALADHNLALSLQPDYVPALLSRSRILNARGDHAGALTDIELGLKAGSDNVPLLDEQSRALVGLGRRQEAIAVLDKATTLAPQRPMLHFRRALIRAEMGDAEGAIADLGREIAVNPNLPGAYVQRGRLLLDVKKDGAAARADFDKAIAVQPAFAAAWAHRSRARMIAGEGGAAEKDAKQALTLDPKEPIAKLTLAGLAEARGSPAEALVLLNDVLVALPGVVEVRNEQVGILMRLGRHEEALQSVRVGRGLAPGNLDLIDLEFAAQTRLGRITEGKADLDRAIAQGYARASTYANRAGLAIALRDFDLAERDVRAALGLDSRQLQANALSGLLAVRAKDWPRADSASAAALSLDAQNGLALAVRAEFLRQQGKTAEADRMLARARDKDPRAVDLVRMIQTR